MVQVSARRPGGASGGRVFVESGAGVEDGTWSPRARCPGTGWPSPLRSVARWHAQDAPDLAGGGEYDRTPDSARHCRAVIEACG